MELVRERELERRWYSELYCGGCDLKFRLASRRLVRVFRCPNCAERSLLGNRAGCTGKGGIGVGADQTYGTHHKD